MTVKIKKVATAIFLCAVFLFAFQSSAQSAKLCQSAVKKTLKRGLKKTIRVFIKPKPFDPGHIKPDIDFDSFQDIKDFRMEPLLFHDKSFYRDFFKTADLSGEKVFLKIITLNKHIRELDNIRALNEIGIPTLFKGVTQTADGVFYMVNRFQEGVLVRIKPREESFYFNSEYQITEETYSQIRRLRDLFFRNGIFPNDLQMLISKKGDAYLIDFERYRIFSKYHPGFLLFMYWTHRNFKKAVRTIERDFKQSVEPV